MRYCRLANPEWTTLRRNRRPRWRTVGDRPHRRPAGVARPLRSRRNLHPRRTRRRHTAPAGRAFEDRLRRPQLSRPRRRARQRGSRRAAALLQAAHRRCSRPAPPSACPPQSSRVDFEGELAIVIGRQARALNADTDLRPYIRGYTIVNDVTARDLQKKDGQWTRAKGFDTFCPCGPFVSSEVNPAAGLFVETRLNGERKQYGFTRDFIFSIPHLLVYITAAMTLEPGDLIPTGTPAGVGPMAAGDTVEVAIEGLGVLRNPVA